MGVFSFKNDADNLGVLDLVPEQAAAAYSVRKLSKDYNGPAIRVRRSSDNTEQDIGFDGSGNLDISTLLTFTSSADGLVTTWYDQSGSGFDATQAVAANQPKIVNAGALVTENGKPAIQSDGVDDYMLTSSGFLSNTETDIETYLIGQWVNLVDTNRQFFSMSDDVNDTFRFYINTTQRFNVSDGVNAEIVSSTANANQHLFTLSFDGTTALLRTDTVGVSETATVPPSIDLSHNLSLFAADIGFLSGFAAVKCQELIIYNVNRAAERTNIESNINNYFKIF